MNKPKTGMYLWFYAVLAFVLAIFGQTLLCGLLLAFVILTERDSWLTCQVIQALGLCFVNSVMGVVSSIFDLVTDYTLAGVSRFFNTTFNVLDQVIAACPSGALCQRGRGAALCHGGLSGPRPGDGEA